MSQKPKAPSLWLALMHAHTAMEKVAQRSISHTGLCYSDFAILESLLHRGPLPVNALAVDIHITSGSMTSAVDRLVGRALVTRTVNPADKRSRVVDLTDEGRAVIGASYTHHAADLERAVAQALDPTEREQLFTLLRKLEEGVRGQSAR